MLYIDDEKYEMMLDTIYSNLSESKYKNIIDGILGIYKMRFTKMQYLLEYQPMFIRAAHKYIYYVRSQDGSKGKLHFMETHKDDLDITDNRNAQCPAYGWLDE